MTRTRHLAAAALALTALLVFALPAGAIPVSYGTFTGPTAKFVDVTEDALTSGDTPPLYGAPNGDNPNLPSDELDFDPDASYQANASGASGTDSTDGQLLMMIEAHPGEVLATLQLEESGLFDLSGSPGDAFASVSANVFIDVVEVDGSAEPLSTGGIPMSFSPSDGNWQIGVDGIGGGSWMGLLTIDLNQLLLDNNVSFVNGVTKLNLTMDNALSALSQTDTTATIQKTDVRVRIVTVPESRLLVLLGLALAALAFRRTVARA